MHRERDAHRQGTECRDQHRGGRAVLDDADVRMMLGVQMIGQRL